jgi:hypothetical protein
MMFLVFDKDWNEMRSVEYPLWGKKQTQFLVSGWLVSGFG